MTVAREILLDGRATIYRGDCLDILRHLDGISHYVTDPPYEKTMHDAKAKRRNVRRDGHEMPPALDFASIQDARARLMPLVKQNCSGWFLAFCTPEGIAPWRDEIESAEIRYKRACFWQKPNAAPQFNGQGPAFSVEPFVTAWCGRGVSRWNGGGRGNWFSHNTNQPDREGTHGTEKPLSLMLELIELFSNPGDLVCDPFMGSATTGVAAIALGRRFVGIELLPAHYQLAKGRLLSTFAGRVEGRGIIAKLTGADHPGPLFRGQDG